MTLEEAITLLERHNRWRRGGEGDMENPTEIGKAIDLVVHELKDIELIKYAYYRAGQLGIEYEKITVKEEDSVKEQGC